MSDRNKKEKAIQCLEMVTKIIYLCFAVSTFHSFLYVSPIQPVLVKLTLVSGTALILLRLTDIRNYRRVPGILLMVLFCISFAVTSVMNRQYGMTENMKWIAWTGIQFFALYACSVRRTTEEYGKEFRLLSHLIIGFSMVAASVSLWMLLTFYSNMITTPEGETVISGFKWGRLWGVYTDPNYGSVFCVIAIVLSVLFFIQKKGKRRIFYGISILLNFLYIVFSDSRTGKLALIFSLGTFLYLWMIRKWSGKRAIRYLLPFFLVLCLGAGLYGSTQVIKSEYNKRLVPVLKEMSGKQETQTKKAGVGRAEELEDNVSNGRFQLWESGVEVWKESPVYGTGYSTFTAFAKEHVPDTYAVNNTQGAYTSLHNNFLNILVFQGILGFVLFLFLAGRLAACVLPGLYRAQGEVYLELAAMLAVISAVGIAMLFLLEGLYTNSPGSFVLWTFAGYMVHASCKIRSERIE